MHFSEYIWLEIIKTGLACLTLALGWFLGQRIVAYWDIKKKKQELDIATTTEFHRLYGEFKTVSRLYRSFMFCAASNRKAKFSVVNGRSETARKTSPGCRTLESMERA